MHWKITPFSVIPRTVKAVAGIFILLIISTVVYGAVHVQEGTPFVAGDCTQAGAGDTVVTTGLPCGSGSGSGGIVSPGTFTWTNTFGISVSTFVTSSSMTVGGPLIGAGGVGNLGQVLASQGGGLPPTFIDPIVSQSTASNLNASCWINGSSNTVQISGIIPVSLSTIQVVGSTVGVVQVTSPWVTSISGTPAVFLATTSVSINGSSNTVQIAGTVPVSGTFFQTTQPVSFGATNSVTVTPGTGTFQVSGTVTTNLSTVTFNNIGQPVTSTFTVIVASNIYNNTLTPVATGQTQLSADENQRLLVTGIPRGQIRQATATLTSTTETVLISSGAAGVFNDLCGCIFTNTSATATRIDLRGQGGAGTINNNFEIPPTDSRGFWPGCQNPFIQLQAASQWSVQLSGGVTDVRVTCQYIPIK